MPKCHHCNANVDNKDVTKGPCRTCLEEDASFCPICGWWEIGPKEAAFNLGMEAVQVLNPIVIQCSKDAPWTPIDDCKLMKRQLVFAPSVRAYEDQGYIFFRGVGWNDAVVGALRCIDHFVVDGPRRMRMHAMMVTYLSAFEVCLASQLERLTVDSDKKYLSLHDVPTLASAHYRSHQGFAVSEDYLDFDCMTLRLVDTIEQYLKGQMTVSMAAYFLRDTGLKAPAARDLVINATILYLALLTVVWPYDDQRILKAGFSAGENGASGIYTKAHIQSCFSSINEFTVTIPLEEWLGLLLTAVGLVPDFQGRPFRFNSQASDKIVDSDNRLTDSQKLYLKSLQDLDDNECPSVCRINVWSATETLLNKFLTQLSRDSIAKEVMAAFKGIQKLDIRPLFTPKNAGGLLNLAMKTRRNGGFTLQTSANDVTYIVDKPYVGLWDLYLQKAVIGDVEQYCDVVSNVKFLGSKYRLSDVVKASDRRKESPFEYVSWRIQKDRHAHKFLPLQPHEYEVTAAVSQAFPLPEPQSTYGKQMIVWTSSISTRCTFKVRDSGRPTRSVLLLIQDLLKDAVKDVQSRNAVLNLLVQLCGGTVNLSKAFSDFSKQNLCFFPDTPLFGMLDIEAHIYGVVNAKDVAVILYPASVGKVKQLSKDVSVKLKGLPFVLYDETTWEKNYGSNIKMGLHSTLATMKLD